jgi:methyl-accepting chemotaxis protein
MGNEMNTTHQDANSGNKTFLGNFPIAWRIGFLIALGLVAMAATITISFIGEKKLVNSIELEEAFSKIDTHVLKAKAGALMLRRREKDFLLRKNMKYWGKYEKDFAQTISELESIKEIPESAPITEQTDSAMAKLGEHKAQFKKVIQMMKDLGLSEKTGLKGELRKTVHGVEAKLKEAGLDDLTVKMLMMRRHEKDFMMRGAKKYLGRIEKRRNEFDP